METVNSPVTSTRSGERGAPDDMKINPSVESECERWARKLGVTVEQLKAAVKAVGPDAEAVERYLRGHAQSSRSA